MLFKEVVLMSVEKGTKDFQLYSLRKELRSQILNGGVLMKSNIFRKMVAIVLFANLSLSMVISPLANPLPMYISSDDLYIDDSSEMHYDFLYELEIEDYVPYEPELEIENYVPYEPELEIEDYVPYEPELEIEDYVPYEPELEIEDYVPYKPALEIEDYVPYEPKLEVEIPDIELPRSPGMKKFEDFDLETQRWFIERTIERNAYLESREIQQISISPFTLIPNSGGIMNSPNFTFIPFFDAWVGTLWIDPGTVTHLQLDVIPDTSRNYIMSVEVSTDWDWVIWNPFQPPAEMSFNSVPIAQSEINTYVVNGATLSQLIEIRPDDLGLGSPASSGQYEILIFIRCTQNHPGLSSEFTLNAARNPYSFFADVPADQHPNQAVDMPANPSRPNVININDRALRTYVDNNWHRITIPNTWTGVNRARITLDAYSLGHNYAVEVYRSPSLNTFARVMPIANNEFDVTANETLYIRVHNANMQNASRSISGQNYVLTFHPLPEHAAAIFIPPADYNTLLNVEVNEYVQWYTFDVTSRSRLWFELHNNTDAIYDMTLFRWNGTSLLTVSNHLNPPSGQRFMRIILPNAIGQYFIRLTPRTIPTDTTGLQLLVNVIGNVDTFEPNDTFAAAAQINLSTDISANIDHQENIDFFRFTVALQGRHDIRLSNVPAGHEYVLRLYNAQRQYITSFSSTGNVMRTVDLPRGNHFISIHSEVGYGTDLGNYTLRVTRIIPPEYDRRHVSLWDMPPHTRITLATMRYQAGGQIDLNLSFASDFIPASWDRVQILIEWLPDGHPPGTAWSILESFNPSYNEWGNINFNVSTMFPLRNINQIGSPYVRDGQVRIVATSTVPASVSGTVITRRH